MDKIRQAVDRARSATFVAPGVDHPRDKVEVAGKLRRVKLDLDHLESNRIVAHRASDERTRAFDMMRTQVLQSMEASSLQMLAVTSPTAGCGKTVTATNLAISIARQPDRSVLLVDMDLRKPKVATYLGLEFDHGLMSALDGRASLLDTVVQADCGPYAFEVLPSEGCSAGSAEWMASQSMTNVLQAIRREFRSYVVIVDLPPMLVGDDVICFLPRTDAVLLIGGAGMSTVSEIAECNKHLQGTRVLNFVLNKASTSAAPSYGYY